MINLEWGSNVNQINANSSVIADLYKLLKQRLLSNPLDEETLHLACIFLENNNILFHRSASYAHYQDIAAAVFKQFNHIKKLGNKELFYRFCHSGVYTDYFINNQAAKKMYYKYIVAGLTYFQARYLKEKTQQMLTNYFLGLIHVSQYYLFLGDLKKNSYLLNTAHRLLLSVSGLHDNYKAFFYYHYSWSYVEGHNYQRAILIIDKLLHLKSHTKTEPIVLHAMNIKCTMLFALKQYEDCYNLAIYVSKYAQQVFSSKNQDVHAESLLNIAKCLIKKRIDLQQAKIYASRAISKLTKLFLGPNVDISQALANIVLGDIYKLLKDKRQAVTCYNFAKDMYEKTYRAKAKKNKNYLALLKTIQSLRG